ncbi:class I SAM-dependent methyltransferase [Streptacidiphilus sp. 4-A2]|nr:class I SAM-dependent methyltransferase [Streptacidiphilus sp. 4-A2]
MEQWRSGTVDRVLTLKPRRVLEIGVGTGLLLSRIAPACEEYWGTDLSPAVVARLQGQLAEHPGLAGRVRLSVQPADDFGGLPEGRFDLVLINSVAQYFPSADYLTGVLRQAMAVLAPGARSSSATCAACRSPPCSTPRGPRRPRRTGRPPPAARRPGPPSPTRSSCCSPRSTAPGSARSWTGWPVSTSS